MKLCNAVFEGGGVRGIGHVGAACAMEEAGYRFAGVAGSSAGALVAALLAAGYRCDELKEELETLSYERFKGRGLLDYFGTAGRVLSLLLTLGIYRADYLEEWIGGLLERKGVRSFGDLKRRGRRLFVTVSDLTGRRLLLLPYDLELLGLDPEAFPVALAVRASASIPVFFQPVRLRDRKGNLHLLADGGLLSNYPIWALEEEPDYPIFGFKFGTGREEADRKWEEEPPNLVGYLKAIMETCMDAIDSRYTSPLDDDRTIWIPTEVKTGAKPCRIGAADFDITRQESQALFANGQKAVQAFLMKNQP